MSIIQQRKKPALRAFTGLTGRPLDEPVPDPFADRAPLGLPITVVTVVPPAVAVKRGRGRPRKHADAATKQAEYRERLHVKKQDSERRTAIAKILKRVKSSMFDSKYAKFGLEIKRENRLRLARLRDELKQVPLDRLKEYLETLEDTPDLHGRLHNERSGEADRISGQSEMERIVAARQYDISLGESERQDPLLSGGFRTRPDGAGADQSEGEDRSVDDADNVRSGSGKPLATMSVSERRRDKAISRIVAQIFYEPDIQDARCLFCDEVFKVKGAAENHLYERYEQGEKQLGNKGLYTRGIIELAMKTSEGIPSCLLEQGPKTSATHHRDLIDQECRRRKFGNIVTDRFREKE